MASAIELYLTNPADTFLEDDNISLPGEYNDFVIMREMGWDWWVFHRQPDFFIDMVKAFILAEQKAKQNRRMNQPQQQQ